MADLDTLQIQISASTSQADDAISRLQKALGSLNASLSNYSDASNYVKGLANLTAGLNGMADAVDRIDTAKIKNIASAIGSLATNGGKLSTLNVAKALTAMGSAAQESSARTKKAVEEIASSFDITSKTGISELTGAVEQFYSVVDDPVAVKAAENNIRDIINTYTQFGTVVEETKEAVREWVSNSNLFLNKDTVAEMGDDFARLRGIIGIQNTNTTDLTKAVGLDVFVEEMNKALGLSIEWGNSVQEIASNLANYLEGGSDMSGEFAEYARNSTLQAERLSEALDKLYASMGRVREAQAEPDYYGAGDGLEYDIDLPFADDTVSQMDAVAAASREMKSSIDSASVSVENVKEELSQEIGNPFAGIVEGISSLVGFEITADQFSGIKTLADSLGKLSGKNAPIAAQNLPLIAQGLQMLSGVNIPAGLGGQLTELGAAVGKLGGKYATNAQGLIHVAEGITALASATNTMPNLDAIRELANAVAAFGRKGAGNAITNLPLLAEGFRNLIVTLSTAPNVSRNVIDLANAMAQVASSGAMVNKTATSGASGLKLFGHSAKQAHKHFKGLASTFGRLYANFFLLIRAVRLFKKAIDISSDLREVQNVVATTFGSATDKVQEFADTAILSFGMSELSAKQFASRFQAMGVAMNVTSEQVARANDFLATKLEGNTRAYQDFGDSMADVSINLTKLTADMASFYNADYEDVAEDMAAVLTGMTRPLRKYGLDLTEATLKEWALANGLDGNIKKMTQAEKTMLRYQYVMANMGHVMGDFVKTQDTWANVTRTIGQQFQKLGQIIGTGFINAFKPALIAFRGFMNTLIELTEKALNALGKLMGWQVEIEDVGVTIDDGMEDYSDSIEDATGNAKKLLKLLLPIDELNVLSDPSKGGGSDSGASGGGGSGTVTGGGITFKPYESDIDDWYDFGKRIADKLRDAMDSINWDSIFGKAKDFGKNLAEFLNGLIQPDTFHALGSTIANALNSIVYRALAFAENFDFENAGIAFGELINGFFEDFDFVATAQAISKLANGFLTFVTSAVQQVEWEDVGEKMIEFFCGIDWKETWFKLSDLIMALKDAMIGVVKGAMKQIEEDPEGFGEAIIGFSGIALTIGGMKLTKFLLTQLIKNKIATLLGGGGAKTLFGSGAKVIGGGTGLSAMEIVVPLVFSAALVWDYKSGNQEERIEQMEDAFTRDAETREAEEVGEMYAAQLGTSYTPQAASSATSMYLIGEIIAKIKKKFKEVSDSSKETTDAMNNHWSSASLYTQEEIQNISNSLSDYTKYSSSAVKQNSTEVQNSITTGFGNAQTAVEMRTNAMKLDISSNLTQSTNSVTQNIDLINSTFTSGFGEAGQTVTDTFSGIYTDINSDMSNATGSVTTELANMNREMNSFSPHIKMPHFSWETGGTEASGVLKSILEALNLPTTLPKLNVDWYASGGYPTAGSLFVAGEAGAEMLGTVGGKTAVASNGEITGIASAIYETASQTNALLRGVITAIDNKETGITDEAIFSSVRSSAKAFRNRTNSDAFA